MKIAVVGLGYVGLPLALQFARSGVTVIGLDIDSAKVDRLNRGESYIKHIDATGIAAAITNRSFSASTDFSRIREVEAVIICVPTPLGKNREPDISYILNTGRTIAPHLQKGTLVVLESTTYPGTTEEDLKNVLEEFSTYSDLRPQTSDLRPPPSDLRPLTSDLRPLTSDSPVPSPSSLVSSPGGDRPRLRAGIDFHLAFSPEREDPGNPNSKVAEIPKIVGGYTPACLERAIALYSKAIKTVVPVSSCRVAEATKLLENIFRSVNIALVNELKLVYGAMGIDIWEVIAAAKTKPFGFMPFYPGPGLGGHCIPIDPFYLSWKARQCGKETRFIELAGEINTAMPQYVVARVAAALNAQSAKRKAQGAAESLLRLERGDFRNVGSDERNPQNERSEGPSERERASQRGHRPDEVSSSGSSAASSTNPSLLPLSPLPPAPSAPPASEPSVPGPAGAQPSTSPLPLCPSPPSAAPSPFALSSLLHARVLVLGLAYKPNVDDDRESPSYVLMNLLKERGVDVAYYDPFVPVIKPSREHSHWAGTRSVSWDQPTISSFDAVLISTAHACVDYRQLADWSPCIIDTRNAMAGIATRPGQVFKA